MVEEGIGVLTFQAWLDPHTTKWFHGYYTPHLSLLSSFVIHYSPPLITTFILQPLQNTYVFINFYWVTTLRSLTEEIRSRGSPRQLNFCTKTVDHDNKNDTKNLSLNFFVALFVE